MQHVQLHVTFLSCIRQVAKDKISSSVMAIFFRVVIFGHKSNQYGFLNFICV